MIKYWMLRPASHQQQTSQPDAGTQPHSFGTAARNIDVDQLSAEQAGHLAAILRPRLPTSLGWHGVWSDAPSAARHPKPIKLAPARHLANPTNFRGYVV